MRHGKILYGKKKERNRENELGDLGSVQVVVMLSNALTCTLAPYYCFLVFVYLVHVGQPCFACAEHNNNNQNNCQSAANLEAVHLKGEYMSKIKY